MTDPQNPHNLERLLTYREAGKLLGVTERSIWSYVDQGLLPAVRFRRSVRINPTDLRRFIDRSKSGPSAEHDKGVDHAE